MNRQNEKHNRIPAALTLLLAMLLVFALLTGCSSSGAEKKVAEDLESMRYVELDRSTEDEIKGMLSEQGKEYFELFMSRAGDFDYEIIDSEEQGSDQEVIVTVRIRTYDFASEYLKTWTEYLEAADDDYDEAELYEKLFRNLSSIRRKDHIADAGIRCVLGEDGSWTTDAASNTQLRNAVFGGMLNEIAGLAGAGN